MKSPLPSFALLIPLGLAFACGGGKEAPAPQVGSSPPTTAAPAPASAPETAALLPIAPRSDSTSSDGAGLRFDLPAGWRGSQPTSSMRVAQAAIPGAGGDGELAVFWFGEGQGGDVESNIQRWIGQMSVAPGTAPRRDRFETNGLAVTWIDVPGTLSASAMGNASGSDQGGWRLYGAVVEGPGGPWFFKATGPEATLASQRNAFLEMLRGASAAPPRPGI